MIQRIQSIWLLLASVCAFLTLEMPFYVGTTKNHEPSHELVGKEKIAIMLLTIIIGTLSFIIIFLFKKRRRQVRFIVLGIMLELLLILLYVFEVKTYIDGTYALTALLHSLVIFFFFLALRGIAKDINTIKKSDRLR